MHHSRHLERNVLRQLSIYSLEAHTLKAVISEFNKKKRILLSENWTKLSHDKESCDNLNINRHKTSKLQNLFKTYEHILLY